MHDAMRRLVRLAVVFAAVLAAMAGYIVFWRDYRER